MLESRLRITLAASTLGSSLAFIDGSVVNVALPALAHSLHTDPSQLSWAINSYLLPLGALTLLGGGLGDHFGRRRLFLIGLLLFAVASLLCAVSPTFVWLLIGRGAQGIGAALLMPNSLAILGGAFSGEQRGRAIGTWAAVGAVAAAVGPIVGGWLIDMIGWRVIFVINIPVAMTAGFLALRFVAEQKETAKGPRLDVWGAAAATAALALLTWSLTEAAGSHRSIASIWTTSVGGLMFLGVFIRQERHLADLALMPLAMFSSSSFVGLTLLTFFLYASVGGLFVLLPFFLIQVHHWSAITAGTALLPIPVFIGASSRLMGRVAARIGGRIPLSCGSLLVGIGLALFGRVGANAVNYWLDIFPPTLLVAAGMGASVSPLTSSVMASVDTDHVGTASGLNSAVARVAGLVAAALLGLVFSKQDSLSGFTAAFHAAAFWGAGSAIFAAIIAVALIRTQST